MAKPVPTNIELDLSEHGRHSISCEIDSHRFHLWLDRGTMEPSDDTVFKNPPNGTPHRGDGWYNTRHLTRLTGQGKVAADAMLAALPGLLPAAQAKLEEEVKAAARLQAENHKLHRAGQAGPQLVKEVRVLLDVVKRPAPEVFQNRDDHDCFARGWDAAMATVFGEMAAARALLRQVEGVEN